MDGIDISTLFNGLEKIVEIDIELELERVVIKEAIPKFFVQNKDIGSCEYSLLTNGKSNKSIDSVKKILVELLNGLESYYELNYNQLSVWVSIKDRIEFEKRVREDNRCNIQSSHFNKRHRNVNKENVYDERWYPKGKTVYDHIDEHPKYDAIVFHITFPIKSTIVNISKIRALGDAFFNVDDCDISVDKRTFYSLNETDLSRPILSTKKQDIYLKYPDDTETARLSTVYLNSTRRIKLNMNNRIVGIYGSTKIKNYLGLVTIDQIN